MTTRILSAAARVAALAGLVLGAATALTADAKPKPPIPLKEAKLNIEHNATDHDTGFQGAIDSDGWKRLDVTGPDGDVVLTFRGRGELADLGLTELFFETNEPENADVPIDQLLARLPEGDYDFFAKTVDGALAHGVATLSHTIPSGPELVTPAAGSSVDAGADLVVSWNPVTTSRSRTTS